jgi:hypothetical protein
MLIREKLMTFSVGDATFGRFLGSAAFFFHALPSATTLFLSFAGSTFCRSGVLFLDVLFLDVLFLFDDPAGDRTVLGDPLRERRSLLLFESCLRRCFRSNRRCCTLRSVSCALAGTGSSTGSSRSPGPEFRRGIMEWTWKKIEHGKKLKKL